MVCAIARCRLGFVIGLAFLATAVPGACHGETVAKAYKWLSSGSLQQAELAQLPAGVVLRSGQIKITQKDLDADVARAPQASRADMKRNMFFLLESKATKAFMSSEAAIWARKSKQDLTGSNDDLIRNYLGSIAKGVKVSDKEIRDFYDANKEMVSNAEFDKVKVQLKSYLLEQKRQEAVDAHIAGISDRYAIEISRPWVANRYAAAIDNPVDKARGSGLPTMVDFGSVGCKPCEMMEPILKSVKTECAGKANIVYVPVSEQQILAARFGIQSIPVQVFFDKDGNEVFRHIGFFPKDRIDEQLAKLGVE